MQLMHEVSSGTIYLHKNHCHCSRTAMDLSQLKPKQLFVSGGALLHIHLLELWEGLIHRTRWKRLDEPPLHLSMHGQKTGDGVVDASSTQDIHVVIHLSNRVW